MVGILKPHQVVKYILPCHVAFEQGALFAHKAHWSRWVEDLFLISMLHFIVFHRWEVALGFGLGSGFCLQAKCCEAHNNNVQLWVENLV
jgi:hypothetical protein